MCEACASGFYLRPDRICSQCPESSGSSSDAERLRAALPFLAGVLGTFVIVAVLVAKVERMSGEESTRKVWVEVTPRSAFGSACVLQQILRSDVANR